MSKKKESRWWDGLEIFGDFLEIFFMFDHPEIQRKQVK
jgi:hypothetical protein